MNRKATTLLAFALGMSGPLSARQPDSPAQPPDSAAEARQQAPTDSLAGAEEQASQEPTTTPADTARVDQQSGPTETAPARPNPFAGFQTHYLSNGLKVWFKRLPDAPLVSVSVNVPTGSDADPPGKEQLAHFTEHILFSDHDGRTEQEINDAVEGLGGEQNGFTYRDHTWYYVTIGQEHGLFAIEWLSGLMEPHAMEPEVVERGRQPVAIEIGAKPREFFEHLWFALNPSWLMPPDFWEQEFGMDARTMFDFDRWQSLQRITPEDLRGFYDRYYAPAAMTLTIVGDLDPNLALATAEQTFGQLQPREVQRYAYELEDPGRRRATYFWEFRPNVRRTSRHKMFEASAEDRLMALFVEDLLRRRLNERLRYGERKAVYGLLANVVTRGPAAYIELRGDIDEAEYAFADSVIVEEMEMLRAGSHDPAEFETDRTALVERLRGDNQTAESLNRWVTNEFYDPDVFTDFPDVLGFYENVSQGEIAAFAARNLVDQRQVLTVNWVEPMSQGLVLVTIVALVWLTFRAVAWILTTPIEMKRLRYVARFRKPVILRVVGGALSIGIGLVLARLLIAGFIWVGGNWVATVDDYWIQSGSYWAMIVTGVALLVVYVSRSPRKLLVFDDHLRVKHLAYRSRVLKPEDIAELSTRRFHNVWLNGLVFRAYPLAFGLVRRGVWLKPTSGRGYFFRTRDTKELIDVLGGWLGRPVGDGKELSGRGTPPSVPEPGGTSGKGEAVGKVAAGGAAAGAGAPAVSKPTGSSAEPAAPPPKPSLGSAVTGTGKAGPSGDAGASTAATGGAATSSDPDAEDVDFDSIGLTEEEMRELLGEE